MSINEPSDFGTPPYSAWTVRGPADDLSALLQRAAEFLDSIAADHAVTSISLQRDGDEAVLGVAFDHWQLPADLDYLHPRVAHHDSEGQRDDFSALETRDADLS